MLPWSDAAVDVQSDALRGAGHTGLGPAGRLRARLLCRRRRRKW